ncbi:MAG: PhoH family protein, partial [Rubrivivax sp.]|nr:PhoH family protein [Rubrivivax sp.]
MPKPPSRKGDLLQSNDYEAQAAPRSDRRTSRTRAEASPAQSALDLHDGGTAVAARAPAQQAALLSAPPPAARPA